MCVILFVLVSFSFLFSSFFLLLSLLSPVILVLSLLEFSLSLDFAQTQTHMPQAPLSNQWVSLFGSIWCFSLSLAKIDSPSVGRICLGLVVPIGGCEVAVVGWRVGLLLEWACFGALVGMVEVVFLLFLFGYGFVDCWLLIAGFVQFCGHFGNDCIDLIFGFKSIFLLENLVCVYIWIDFVLYNILLWFFCVWFLGFYDFFWVCALVCSWWVCMIFWVCLIF